ncbi:hypothetical protein K2Q16_00515 [Patescibacteria group bacterium]|nr:hypothetical protein [Patescibacteria group bacterium]
MRICIVLLALAVMGCGAREQSSIVAIPVVSRVPHSSFFYPPREPACYSTDARAQHLVLFTLGGEAHYYHRDASTSEWIGNLGVRRVLTTMQFAEGERTRTGVIQGFSDTILTIRFVDGRQDYFVFPSAFTLSSFLGRIVGPRGVPSRELRRTAIIALDKPCGEASSRE